jgi:dihydrofolate synthase/folylpolyglutamate synthase
MTMTYEEALAYLETFVNYEHTPHPKAMRQMTLEGMRRLCQRLGEPQRSFRSVLVAGTNGKGSICAMLYSMLRQTPLRAGLYTSPHVEDLRERIRVWRADRPTGERTHADDWVTPEAFAGLVEQLQPHLDAMGKLGPEERPTYFEVLTALAFLYFSQQRVEVAVVEVGLGGRLDATNVLQQAVSVLGPIGVDHVEILGADPALIAREKGGIIKPRQTVFSAPQSEMVEEVLRVICEQEGAPLLICGRDLTAAVHRHDLRGLDVTVTGLRGLYESLKIPLLGRHQAQNAALAIGALEALSPMGIPHSIVERGLAQVEWPGRLEVVHEEPLVVMDGAHNPQAAAALRETLMELSGSRRIHLLIGMSSDKSVEGIGETVGRLAISATCTKSRHPRAMDPTALAKRLSVFCPDVHVMSDAADAYTYLLNAVSPSDAIVVTGSLYVVGELRTALRHANGRMGRAVAAAS